MYAPELNNVLLSGTLSAGPFNRRGLTTASYVAPALPASARALVFMAGDLHDPKERATLVGWARRNVRLAHNHGIGCVIASARDQENLAKQTLAASPETILSTVVSADPEVVAQACLSLRPGPLPNDTLVIGGAGSLDPETDMLLKRAFADFDSIDLVPLDGGRSDITGIWRVDARSRDAELRSPFVAKCGPRASIKQQVDTYRDVVADRVPYRGCAPLCLDRSIAGFSKRLAVSRFVEQAKRLDEVLIDPNHPNVSNLIENIFSGPLHRWRRGVERRQIKLVWQFLPGDVVASYGYGMRKTRNKLAASGFSVPTPSKLVKRLTALPRIEAPICRAHDDLNFRNVFVGAGGREIILIDFTRAIKRVLSKDVARMDVGFAFDDELNEKQPVSDDVLMDYFTGDLFSISLRHVVDGKGAKARLAAIESLRHHILTEADEHGYDPRVEYTVAIISGLLYEAKRQTKWSGIAYRCADLLSATL